jgi:hypothetical protein
VPLRNLRFFDADGVAHLAPGRITLTAAAAAPYAEATQLGAAEPLTAEVALVE